jgi:hypothetical protein
MNAVDDSPIQQSDQNFFSDSYSDHKTHWQYQEGHVCLFCPYARLLPSGCLAFLVTWLN